MFNTNLFWEHYEHDENYCALQREIYPPSVKTTLHVISSYKEFTPEWDQYLKCHKDGKDVGNKDKSLMEYYDTNDPCDAHDKQ